MTQPHGRSLADRYPDAVDLVVAGASAIVVCVGTIIQRGTDQDALFGAATLGVGVGAVVLWSMRRRRDRAGRAAAALLEQRLSIARELHDVVAHHVSLIGVEAAAARRTLDRSPSETAVALSAITNRPSTFSCITTLRRPDPTDDGTGTSRAQAWTVAASPAPPAPTLADLPAMCQRIREAGLAIDA